MHVEVNEIAADVFRISMRAPGSDFSYGCFLIRDDEPAMVETSFNRAFDTVHDAVRRLIDPSKLRYLFVPHFEMDECGSLNRFLAVAPHAEPVCTHIGAELAMDDFSDKPPKVVSHGEKIQLGRKELTAIYTPWVHFWDSMLVYDETDRILFTSDLFGQAGIRQAIVNEDLSEEMVEMYREAGAFPSQKHLEAALDRIEPLAVGTLACHHGSVLAGDPRRYYRALRENAVGDIVDAPFYGLVVHSGAVQ